VRLFAKQPKMRLLKKEKIKFYFSSFLMPTKPTSKLNRERHLANKMPAKPTEEQRAHRHREHSKHCKCREMSDAIKKLVKESRLKK